MAKGLQKFAKSQLIIPLISLFLLIVFNLIRDVGFFEITIKNGTIQGNVMSILNNASELVILAIGMTLVTASSKGQDISVGAGAAIAGSVFVSFLKANEITVPIIIVAFLLSCVAAIACGAFNGTLVAAFKIQPMIATLVLFTAGRSIAYIINGGVTPTVESPLIKAIGSFIPHVPINTPILIVCVFVLIVWLVLKFTNLRLYTQAIGINEKSARLNGINAPWIKLLSFMILGVCVAIAGCIRVARIGLIQHESILLGVEMDAILAVAIGGNALGGGKFSIAGSVLGAYVIQTLTTTLLAMKVPPESLIFYKAIVVIIIVVISSPPVKNALVRDNSVKTPPKYKQIDKNGELTI